jgi:peptidoglycan/xylan/chitin deacetylase (PgdA/CDA1 family)
MMRHSSRWESAVAAVRRTLAPTPTAFLVVGLLVLVCSIAGLLLGSAATSAAPGPTVVSFTFDDGRAVQYSARGPLAAHGMRGTFYVNSGLVASSTGGYYMTWAQLQDLASDGNEITGHSLTHAHLTQLQSADLRHEVCDDRTNLLNHGFSPVLSFAYPYAEYNSTVQAMVRDCGYTSARGVGNAACSGCAFAETIPPLDPYATRTPDDITNRTSLATMQSYVTQAEQNGGGWLQLVFHDIGTSQGISLSQFTAFLDWLQPRAANGTVVKTVNDVINGGSSGPGPDTFPPVTTIACNGSACSGWYAGPVTVTLAATDTGSSGVAATRYTTDGTEPNTSSTLYSGPFDVTTTTVRYRSWDNAGNAEATKTQAIQIDTTAPVVSITAPAGGSTITSGNLIVAANASDSQSGVRQVVFNVDGTAIGTSTSAPYQVRWRTRKFANGPHVLTAVATDVAGNATTSAPVTVTLS